MPGRAPPLRSRDVAEPVVFRHEAFHHIEHAFDEGNVDDLAVALAGLDPQQRHQRAHDRMH